MTTEPRMLNKKEAMRYMRVSQGRFHSILQKHGYAGVRYEENAAIFYDVRVLDKILDSYQPARFNNPATESFNAAWKGVTA